MTDTHTLTNHRDIKAWVTERRGMPAIQRSPDPRGSVRAKLALSFGRARLKPALSVDDGISPCSWSAWLAELDRQQLALRVSRGKHPDYEFVERRELN